MAIDSPATLNLDDIDDDIEEVSAPDTTPPASSVPTCEVCGKVIPYSGRGRKPKKCEEHRSSRASNLGTRKSTGSVAQAVTSLGMLYDLVGLSLLMVGAHGAHAALEASIPGLQAKNEKYLAQDPELVKRINSAGKIGGRTGFIAAQVMTLGPVAFLAYAELTAARETAPKPTSRPRATSTQPVDIPAMMNGFPVG